MRIDWPVLGAVSAGGTLGALGRYGLATAFPTAPGAFPWATFATNVAGCALIGVLMVLVTDVWTGRTLLRPFLGVGVLGGFTTFSTYTVEVIRLASAVYLFATLAAALAAVYAGLTATRWAVTAARRRR